MAASAAASAFLAAAPVSPRPKRPAPTLSAVRPSLPAALIARGPRRRRTRRWPSLNSPRRTSRRASTGETSSAEYPSRRLAQPFSAPASRPSRATTCPEGTAPGQIGFFCSAFLSWITAPARSFLLSICLADATNDSRLVGTTADQHRCQQQRGSISINAGASVHCLFPSSVASALAFHFNAKRRIKS